MQLDMRKFHRILAILLNNFKSLITFGLYLVEIIDSISLLSHKISKNNINKNKNLII